MKDCLFCEIINGEIPAYKIYEDDYTLAFLDIRPNSMGHALVIPKDHFENIYTLPDETLCRVMLTARKISLAIKNGLDADGLNITMNNEEPAGQVIFHAHIHVIPRYLTEGLDKKHFTYAEGEMETVAEKIKKLL